MHWRVRKNKRRKLGKNTCDIEHRENNSAAVFTIQVFRSMDAIFLDCIILFS